MHAQCEMRREEYQKKDLLVFSLKGWNNLAQGIALGLMMVELSGLKGRDNGPPSSIVAPLQGASCCWPNSQGYVVSALQALNRIPTKCLIPHREV